jgi:NodT family efflux transporter outer membrane factor (OMF) lipoprotein
MWHHELTQGTFVSEAELRNWWTILNDPILDGLIARARERNLGLYAAATRIYQARLQRAITAVEKLPLTNGAASYTNLQQSGTVFPAADTDADTDTDTDTDADAGAGVVVVNIPRGLFSGNRDIWSFGFDSSWEIDVFGRIHRLIEAADANWQVSVEAYRDVMVTLYAEVARNYVQVRTLQSQLEYAYQNVQAQAETLSIAKEAVEAGLAPILDVHQAETNLATTEANIPPLERQLHVALHRIAVLLGQYPGAVHSELLVPAPVPSPPRTLPMILPANLIRQRPDIRQAERALAARVAEVGVATADFYPRFSLVGSFGVDSRKASSLFVGDSWRHAVGPAVIWPIFEWGRVRNNLQLSRAVAEEALVNYEQTLLVAVEEVENALVGYRRALETNETLRRSEDAAEKSVDAVMALYREGETNFLNVLESQRALFLIQDRLAASDGEIMLQLIAIYRSLGGGWEEDSHCQQPFVRLCLPPDQSSVTAPNFYPDTPSPDSVPTMDETARTSYTIELPLTTSVGGDQPSSDVSAPDITADLWTSEIGRAARSAHRMSWAR